MPRMRKVLNSTSSTKRKHSPVGLRSLASPVPCLSICVKAMCPALTGPYRPLSKACSASGHHLALVSLAMHITCVLTVCPPIPAHCASSESGQMEDRHVVPRSLPVLSFQPYSVCDCGPSPLHPAL